MVTKHAKRALPRLLIAGVLLSLLCSIALPARLVAAAITTHQAENATISQGIVESNHAGFTGTGFVNYNNVAGSFVEWTVNTSQAGTMKLIFRYANGTTTNRPMEIRVNGSVLNSNLAFNGTGAWSTWATQSLNAALSAGNNTIRATATTASGGPNVDRLDVDDLQTPSTDWSVAMVDSTMRRFTPDTIGGWSYPRALYLYGQYLVYKRTGNRAYFDYVKAWVDRFVPSDGNINNSFNNLDSMLGGNLLVIMFQETGQAKYRIAAGEIHNRLTRTQDPYPTTSDGGYWHSTSDSRAWQLWADGVFMSMPFMARYGQAIGDTTRAYDIATRQLVIYFSHLQRSNGLLWHAYDEKKVQSWANPTTGTSPESWCRAIGWFAMATVDILEIIPANHPRRAALIDMVRHLATGFERYQDPVSGRWFQVVDKGDRSDNWTETSCSSMYTYMLSKGAERGYIDGRYQTVAQKGYQGVLARISLDSNGLTNLTTISEGTNVGSYSYYIARARNTNDFHGLGAFLIMYEQLSKGPSGTAFKWIEAESGTITPPLQVQPDSTASGGAGIQVAAGNNSNAAPPSSGIASYTVQIDTAGTYKVWGRAIAPSSADDSFWVRMDGGTWVQWNEIPLATAWQWDDVHESRNANQTVLFNLTAGSHTLEVAYREDGTRLDKLLVTNDLSFVPTGSGG